MPLVSHEDSIFGPNGADDDEFELPEDVVPFMDDAQLEAQGVAALGARRKMLKTFELVRKKMGIEGGPPATAV